MCAPAKLVWSLCAFCVAELSEQVLRAAGCVCEPSCRVCARAHVCLLRVFFSNKVPVITFFACVLCLKLLFLYAWVAGCVRVCCAGVYDRSRESVGSWGMIQFLPCFLFFRGIHIHLDAPPSIESCVVGVCWWRAIRRSNLSVLLCLFRPHDQFYPV